MKRQIPFFKPVITPAAIREVSKVLRSGWLTSGPKVRAFEEGFAKYAGARHGLALNSGTAALHLALDAISLKAGDEVILPTNTFAATAEVVEYFNARPVLCDVRADTQNIDESKIEALVTRKTWAIMPVHYAGHPCEMDTILKIARRRGLKVIEDAAHCTPAYYKGRPIGSLGDITCFSFYANKCITTGEGGMAVTNNPKYHARMKMMSLHGLSRDAWNRFDSKGSWYYQILDRGFKYNMTDVAAALGLHQLAIADRLWKKRRAAARHYQNLLSDLPGLTLPVELKGCQSAWYIYPIRVDHRRIDRDGLIDHLSKKGVKTSVHFIPLHTHPFYKKKYGLKSKDFPMAYDNYLGAVTLPLYPEITPADQHYIARQIRAFV